MAVFLINNCKFNGCGITFPTLGDLIQHIEDTHIDNDPRVLEKQELQQPQCLPLSYVLRFFTDAARKENLEMQKKKQRAQSPAATVRSTTPTGSEFDDEELLSESEDSNDSWTTQEEFSSEFILRYGSRLSCKNAVPNKIIGASNTSDEKPFACPVPGCKKRYKNVNGIKYHAKNGHRKDARVKKAFKCQCGKSYKTAKGLRSHSVAHHGAGVTVMSPTGEVLQMSSFTAISPLHQVTLNSSLSTLTTSSNPPQCSLPVVTSSSLTPTRTSNYPVTTSLATGILTTISSATVSSPTTTTPIGLPMTPLTPGVNQAIHPSPAVTPPSSASPVSPQQKRNSNSIVNYSPLTPTSPNTPSTPTVIPINNQTILPVMTSHQQQ